MNNECNENFNKHQNNSCRKKESTKLQCNTRPLQFNILMDSKTELAKFMKEDLKAKSEIEMQILQMQLKKEELEVQLLEKELLIKEQILERESKRFI